MSEPNREILTHKPMQFRRYNANKRGSHEVNVWFYDHEVSGIIGALRIAQEHHEKLNHMNYANWLSRLEKKMSRALGAVLKVELKDLKLTTEKELINE